MKKMNSISTAKALGKEKPRMRWRQLGRRYERAATIAGTQKLAWTKLALTQGQNLKRRFRMISKAYVQTLIWLASAEIKMRVAPGRKQLSQYEFERLEYRAGSFGRVL